MEGDSEILEVEEFCELDPEVRRHRKFPLSISGIEEKEILELVGGKPPAKIRYFMWKLLMYRDDLEQIHCLLLASTDPDYHKLYVSSHEEIMADAMNLGVGMEFEESIQELFGNAIDNELFGIGEFHFRQLALDSSISLEDEGNNMSESSGSIACRAAFFRKRQYQRQEKKRVLLAGITIETTAETSCGSFIRFEHHTANRIALLGLVDNLGDYETMAKICADLASLVAIRNTHIPLLGQEEKNSIHCEAASHSISIADLITHEEVIISSLDTSELNNITENVCLEFRYPAARINNESIIPPQAIRTLFIIPIFDIAALHGHGEVKICISSQKMCIFCQIDLTKGIIGYVGGSLCSPSATFSGVRQLFQRMGLKVNLVAEKAQDHQSQTIWDIHISLQLLIRPLFDCNQSSRPLYSSYQLCKEKEQEKNPSKYTNVWEKTQLYIVEDQATLAHRLGRVAAKHSPHLEKKTHLIISPASIASFHFTISESLDDHTIKRIVIIFDEHIFTLNQSSLKRIPYSGTQLRDDLLQYEKIQQAFTSDRLIFIAFSSLPVQDPNLHMASLKGASTVSKLFKDLDSLLSSPSSDIVSKPPSYSSISNSTTDTSLSSSSLNGPLAEEEEKS